MASLTTPNYREATDYLNGFGIDANRIPADKITPAGYEYVVEDDYGRPIYATGFQLQYEFHEWPEKGIYENVVILLDGGTLKKEAPVVTNLKGLDPKAVEAAKKTTPAPKATTK